MRICPKFKNDYNNCLIEHYDGNIFYPVKMKIEQKFDLFKILKMKQKS